MACAMLARSSASEFTLRDHHIPDRQIGQACQKRTSSQPISETVLRCIARQDDMESLPRQIVSRLTWLPARDVLPEGIPKDSKDITKGGIGSICIL